MNHHQIQARILAWKKQEEERIRRDLHAGKYGVKMSIARRDMEVVAFEARRLWDEVDKSIAAFFETEAQVHRELDGLTGITTLKLPPKMGKGGL